MDRRFLKKTLTGDFNPTFRISHSTPANKRHTDPPGPFRQGVKVSSWIGPGSHLSAPLPTVILAKRALLSGENKWASSCEQPIILPIALFLFCSSLHRS